jgi:CheY-like chemotaxis protein
LSATSLANVPISVLLVDDAPEVRRLLRTALRFRGAFSVVGEAADGSGAIAIAARLQPDIVVLDIGLPDLAGQEVLTRIRRAAPTTKVVVFSGTHPSDSVGIAERVEGYALKDTQLDYLIELLETLGRQRTGHTALALPAALSSAGEARAFTRIVLDRWHASELLDDTLLVVSELVTNAVTHAGSECELRISVSPGSLRVEVVDHGIGTPDPLPPSPSRSHGRGLHLIDAVTAAWGVKPEAGGGKMVWAELRRVP